MQIASVASANAASAIQQGASIKIAAKALDQQKADGRAALSLIESAAQARPKDVEPGKGLRVDTYA